MNKAIVIPSSSEIADLRTLLPERVLKGKFIVSEIVKQLPDGSISSWRKFEDGSEENLNK